MPKYTFRLEAQDGSGHYRQGTGVFADEDEARMYIEAKETRAAVYRLTTADLAELSEVALPAGPAKARDELAERFVNEGLAMEEFRSLPPRVRAAVAAHHQGDPYKLVSLEEVS